MPTPPRPCLWLAILALVGAGAVGASPATTGWEELEPGLDLGTFTLSSAEGTAQLIAVRVDAARWELGTYTLTEHGLESGLTGAEWATRFGLAAVINAGMYGTDYRTHVGHLRNGEHVNNAHRNAYRSVAVFRPRRDDLPPFRIVDLDEPGADLGALIAGWECVVQNLRLIKRPRENRWSPQERRWSEAALGEDGQGRALLLFCRAPFSMHEFNLALLDTEELDLVAAQHLEGGSEAQLFLEVGGRRAEWVGSFETGIPETAGRAAWPVPNVIGVRRRR